MKFVGVIGAFALTLLAAGNASASSWAKSAEKTLKTAMEQTVVVQHNGQIEVGFAPGEGAEKLVLKVIDGARYEVRLMAYSFTSASVVNALVKARKRGVDVLVVVDEKHNLSDRAGKAAHALSTLHNAGIPVRTVSEWPIQHSKVIVTDRRNVETGSFNYSASAADRNSENVLVIWNNPELAEHYLRHWGTRYLRGREFKPNY